MIRHSPLPDIFAAALSGMLALACSQSSPGSVRTGGEPGTGGSAGSGGTGTGGTSSVTGGSSARGGGSGDAGGSGGLVQTSGGTAGAGSGVGGASGGSVAVPSGGAAGTRTGGSASTTPGSGGISAGGTGGTAPAMADAGQDSGRSDAVVRDGSAEPGGAGGAGGGSDGPTATGGSGDGGVDPNKKIKVWLAGDSTMMDCTGVCPCGWGSQFQPLLSSNATVVNSAVGGRSIQTWLYDPNVTTTMGSNGECVVDPKTYSSRWQAMLDTTSGMKAGDYLFIEFGINDGDSTCNRHVGTALFQSYLGTMAEAAKKLGAQPVFLTSTSYIGCSGSTAASNRGFVTETKAAGKANDVPVIDLTALSAALYTSLGFCPNSDDYTSTTSAVGKFFCDDHTHFEATGATQIAKVVAKAIKDQGIGLAAYLR